MKTFKHSGDLGDIIYSLPTVRALGGGILYLDPKGGETNELIQKQIPERKTKLNVNSINSIKPLLELQNYISEVKIWNGEPIDYDLDNFRKVFASQNKRDKNGNLTDLHLQYFGLPSYTQLSLPWLHVDKKTTLNKKIVISRSPRVQGGYGTLNALKYMLSENAIFVGHPKEHEYFEWIFGVKIEYLSTPDILDLARVINGCETFFGNSSFPLSLAIGMNHSRIVQELDPKVPVTIFSNMPQMQYI